MNKFLNILAFAILIGNDKVLEKSPDYIMEQFERYCGGGKQNIEFMWGLDENNRLIFDNYVVLWKRQIAVLEGGESNG